MKSNNPWKDDLLGREGQPPEDDDDSAGDWRNSRHAILSCLVTDDDGYLWVLPYHDITFQRAGRFQGDTFTLRFTNVEGKVFDMTLTAHPEHADKFESTIERLCAGKKERIRPRPVYVKSVVFSEVAELTAD